MDMSDDALFPEDEAGTQEIPLTKISYISGRPATLHLRKCKLVSEREDGTSVCM